VSRPNIIPALRYRDARAAIEFLTSALGFEAGLVVGREDGGVGHAELQLGAGTVMLGSTGAGDDRFDQTIGSSSVYVVLEEVDTHYEHARAAGAEIVREMADTDYGSREYTARDPEGNLWSFGTYWPGSSG
jgi:uncharacterized glyoxalase superfamily protein PhnB